ncbi:NACHT domain-containing protein [Lactococcus garvieae]|uniref:NACHT domain-containing protein n=1 Tax=Lactococcus garvieae TaxID=1363 RepID=UPI00030475B7|nr:NACHT domain-containing protein [Lactococcus garvieae]
MLIQHILQSGKTLQIKGTAGSGKTHFLKLLLKEALSQKQFEKIEIFSMCKEEWKEFEKKENVEHIHLTEFMQRKISEETQGFPKLIIVDGFSEICELEDDFIKAKDFKEREEFLKNYILKSSRTAHHKVIVSDQTRFLELPSQKISFNIQEGLKKRGHFIFEEEISMDEVEGRVHHV